MDLEQARKEISAIDEQLVGLFVRRMEAAGEIARYKKENRLPVLDRERERAVLNHVAELAGEAYEQDSRVLYATLFDLSRSYQNRMIQPPSALASEITQALEKTPQEFPRKAVVACQGVEGAYSQFACDKMFPQANIMYFRRFGDVFQAVSKGLCRYGILPIENSSAGSVAEVYDLMRRNKFYIVRSLRLRVSHTLLAKHGTELKDVREIFSHEQAINQCSEFLKTLKDVKITVCENTATAAKRVMESDRTDVATISSKSCAELYGLKILSDTIQNSENNYTRFICISKNLEIYPGADKTSLMLSIPHQPGSLYALLAKFAVAGLNLTKLESRPMVGKDFEFVFYFDVSASIYSPQVKQLLGQLDTDLEEFHYLGSYSEML